MAEGIITADPFAGYEPKRPERVQKYLTADELHRLMTTPLHHPTLYQTRDLFLFSCYTGIPYGDMCRLSEDDLEIAEDGEVWIKPRARRRRSTTNCRCSIFPSVFSTNTGVSRRKGNYFLCTATLHSTGL